MRNSFLSNGFLAFATTVLLASAAALAQRQSGTEVRSASVLLKEWGEDVNYSASYDRDHEAYKALRQLGVAAVPTLVQAFRQSTTESNVDSWTRDNAACVLLDMGPEAKAAVPDLVTLLGTENDAVRGWAAQILGKIGTDARAAVPELLASFKVRRLRAPAAVALGEIGAEANRVVPALVRLLTDPDDGVRRCAIIGLGNFRSAATESVPFLFPFLRSEEKPMREVAAWAIREIAPEQAASIEQELKAAAEVDQARYEAAFRRDPGLYCRTVASTKKIEQGLPLKVHFEARAVPSELPRGVKHLNGFLIQEFLKLHLTNLLTGQTLFLDVEKSDGPWQLEDEGKEAKPLDGRRLGPWEVWFRLVRLRDSLEPGTYLCAVELAYPKNKSKYWHRKTDPAWEQFGFWSGRIWSPPFQLEILKETLQKRRFVVPGQPHLERGRNGEWRLVLKKAEASIVELETRNGFFLGEEIESPGGRSLSTSLSDSSKADRTYEIPHGTKWPKFAARVFETADPPPGHLWGPGPGSGGYKVLWEVNWKTNLALVAEPLK